MVARALERIAIHVKGRPVTARGLALAELDIYSNVSALFRDAKLADLIERSPCVTLGPPTEPIRDPRGGR